MNRMRISGFSAAVLMLAVLFSQTGCSSGGGGGGGGGDTDDGFVGTFDATGSWNGTWKLESAGLSGGFSVKITQSSGKLSGTITISKAGLSDAPLTGAVTSNDITFGDISGIVSFSGSADVFDAASGTFTVKQSGSSYTGTWTAACIRSLSLVKTVTLPFSSSFHSLAWDGTGFWVSDNQRIAKVGADGSLLASFMYNDMQWPFHDFASLCWTGTELLALEESTEASSFTESKFFRINRTTGEPTNPLPCPPDGSSSTTSNGLSLAWAGTTLYCLRSSGYPDGSVIYKTNAATGTSLGTVPFPVPTDAEGGSIMPQGFGAAGSDLYLSNWGVTVPLFKIRATDGKILRRFTSSVWDFTSGGTGSPGSVTWDGTYLWVRDTQEGKLYAFTMPSGLAP